MHGARDFACDSFEAEDDGFIDLAAGGGVGGGGPKVDLPSFGSHSGRPRELSSQEAYLRSLGCRAPPEQAAPSRQRPLPQAGYPGSAGMDLAFDAMPLEALGPQMRPSAASMRAPGGNVGGGLGQTVHSRGDEGLRQAQSMQEDFGRERQQMQQRQQQQHQQQQQQQFDRRPSERHAGRGCGDSAVPVQAPRASGHGPEKLMTGPPPRRAA